MGGRLDLVEPRMTVAEERTQELDDQVAQAKKEAWSEEALVTLIKKHSPRNTPAPTRENAPGHRPQVAANTMGPNLDLRGWERTTHRTAITEEATHMLEKATHATRELIAQVKVPYVRGSECHLQFKSEEGLQQAFQDLQSVCREWPQRRW
eukprot:898888-Amphidinium_carterae.1